MCIHNFFIPKRNKYEVHVETITGIVPKTIWAKCPESAAFRAIEDQALSLSWNQTENNEGFDPADGEVHHFTCSVNEFNVTVWPKY